MDHLRFITQFEKIKTRKLKTLKKIAFNNCTSILILKDKQYKLLSEEESQKIGLENIVNYVYGFNKQIIIIQ